MKYTSLVASVFLTVLVLTGCVTTSAPEVTQFQGRTLQISAQVTPGLFDGRLILIINNEVAIDQRSQAFGGSSQSFEGVWDGRQVTARATRVQNMFSSYVQIDVFIGGQLVETLTV